MTTAAGHFIANEYPSPDITANAAYLTVVGKVSPLVVPAWEALCELLPEGEGLAAWGINAEGKKISVEVNWVGDAQMRSLNFAFRDKDASTDVLSFPLLTTEAPLPADVEQVALGAIVLSVPYALEATQAEPDEPAVQAYLLERVVHGYLHLLGMHHDTMDDYEQVKTYQAQVLSKVLSGGQ